MRLHIRSMAVVVALVCSACPPDKTGGCPVPERVVLDDCSSIVDVASFPARPEPPPCPAVDPLPPSRCPDGGAAAGGAPQTQAELEAFRGCTSVDGDLLIQGSVCSLAPLASLTTITGDLLIGGSGTEGDNLPLVDLDGLGALVSVGAKLEIISAPRLASLDGLDAIQDVGDEVVISQLPALIHLHGPDSLVSIGRNEQPGGGDLTIATNTGLALIDGFESLEEVRDTLALNGGGECIDGFSSLVSVRQIDIHNPVTRAAPGLTHALIAGAPTLTIDAAAFDLLTLPVLTELGGLHIVGGPETLRDLCALSGIESIGDLRVVATQLESLRGLEAVASLGSLELINNSALEDLSALAEVTTTLSGLTVQGDIDFDLASALPGVTAVDDMLIAGTNVDRVELPSSFARIGSLDISRNESLDELGPTDATIGDALIARNAPISNEDVVAWLQTVTVEGVAKHGNNDGERDLCLAAWVNDGICDEGICNGDDDCAIEVD